MYINKKNLLKIYVYFYFKFYKDNNNRKNEN